MTLPASLSLGPAHLRVADLDRAVAWYQDRLGLQVAERPDDRTAALGSGGEPVLVLHEHPGARPKGRHAGLFHVALLYPTREELARALARLVATGTSIDGASDHETHEALYLGDTDGNGLELAADSPREQWPEHLGYAGGPKPLDVDALMATIAGEAPAAQVAPGLRVGHLHLHVGDIARGLAFYRDVLGFELQAQIGDSAAFVSAGGYHHHLGFNVWNGTGVPPAPADAVGLRHWTVRLGDPAALPALRERLAGAGIAAQDEGDALLVRDPWETAVRVEA